MKDPIALFLCEESGETARPWSDGGVECWCVDTAHPAGVHRDGNIVRVGCDVLSWLPPRRDYLFACAMPPCTDLANSGNRWKADKGLGVLASALAIVDRCRQILEWTEAPWFLENPVGSIATYWRKPDYVFQPWNFGDLESKKTCLWTGGGFVMPELECVERPENVKESVWRMAPGPDRARLRSKTFAGFARAVYEANKP